MPAKPFVITPASSASNEQLVSNMTYNMDTIPVWFERCKKNNGKALIFSAGPSTKVFLRDYKHLIKDYDAVFCIKHALPLLIDAGIEPDFCVVLDPRSIDNISTLGHKRSELYDKATKKTTFFVASMTHTSVTKHLMEKGYNVVGWQALTPEMQSLPNEYKKRILSGPNGISITGGTSSGTRTIELSFYMGFTRATVVGFDSSFEKPKPTNIKDRKGKMKFMKIEVNKRPFWTTGELIAQAQDFERFVKNPKLSTDLTVFDTGLESSLVNEIVRTAGNQTVGRIEWKKYK